MWTLLAFIALAAPVTFQVNDALVKDRPVADAKVRATGEGGPIDLGTTDGSGRLVADLAPGTWQIAFAKEGYVPIPGSPTVIPAEGTTITAALSPLLEATGDVGHTRVQIVVTWGSEWSDVRDLDAHLVCSDGHEIYFADRDHVVGHEVRLDVDDVDWGGPETITLVDPPAGRYEYFVKNFSGNTADLGGSDVVVRVVFGDEPVGEYRPPPDVTAEEWLPFEALVVESDGRPRIEPFDPEEVAQGMDRRSGPLFDSLGCDGCMVAALFPIGLGVLWLIGRTQGKRLRRLFR